MSENTVSTDVLKKIKKEKLAPKPRWAFMLRRSVLWMAAVISVLVGGLGASVGLYMIRANDYDLYKEAGGSLFIFILATAPYLWVGLLILLGFIAFYNVKHTKGGYKYHGTTIFFFSITLSLLLGIGFSVAGVGRWIDNQFEANLPGYSEVLAPRHEIFANPEEGLLTGKVLSIESLQEVVISDLEGNVWTVYFEKDHPVKAGQVLRMLGEQTGEFEFRAKKIISKPEGEPFGPKKRFERLNKNYPELGERIKDELRTSD